MTRILITIFFVFISATASPAHAEQFVLYWPDEVLQTDKDLEIYEISISMACGQFRAIRNVPEDWNLEIIRPVSARTELKASSGHGASHLKNMLPLNGVIVISVDEATCFDINAQLITFSAGRSYGKIQMKLKKESNIGVQGTGQEPPRP
jgi:hypothetical protein